MRKLSILALASLALAGCQTDSTTAPPVTPPVASAAQDNSYIVVMRTGTTKAGLSSMQSSVDSAGGDVEHTYNNVFRGFAARMSASAAQELRSRADVALVEPDGYVYAVGTQTNAPWNLDRLDQASLPLDNSYTTSTNGDGVSAYIIDTGIRASHNEFGGRAVAAFSAIGGTADDCNGHGTHVAGTIGGATYGVAKHVKLYGVRVMDCTGNGRVSGVIAGIDWVTANARKPAVANMSLGGNTSAALDAALQNSIASGVTYTVAAGNSGGDACNESPARVPQAITVAAISSNDARASFSNFGSCVDLFAPGVDITSAWLSADDATISLSGTSMASPHAAGMAALYLENHPAALPAEVSSALVASASAGKVSDPQNSPNLLLSTLRSPAAAPIPVVDNPPVAKFTSSCVFLVCTLDASGSTDDNRIASYNWSMPGAVVSAAIGATAVPTYLTAGIKSITLTVTDNAGQSTSVTQNVAVAAQNQAPVAQFSYSCTYLTCNFDGSASTDDAGVASWSWAISSATDNTTLSGATSGYTFSRAGTFTVALTVRDAAGLSNTLARSVTVSAANQAPSVGISSPTNDITVALGTNINFVGSGTDPEDGTLGGTSLTWTSSISGTIGTGASFWTSALPVGNHVITLTAKDAGGLTASTSRTIHITSVNQPPTATITSPATGTTAYAGGSVTFVGLGTDAEDGTLAGSSLTWSSSINGVIGTGATVTTSALSPGTHTITLTAKDAQGATASASLSINVRGPNQAPTAAIATPSNGASFTTGSSITFVGSGSDPEEGALSGAALLWMSSINGAFGTGTSVSTSSLSAGTHTITLLVIDSQGSAASVTRTITIGAPAANQSPSASISSPVNGASFTQGASVTFVGAGSDPEDGTLSGTSLTWTSSINGAIGTGASFSTSTLAAGTHTITLTAKDSKGATASTTRSITITVPVNQAPTASISSPANGTSFTQGASVTFIGAGSDPEDGALSGTSLTWSSNINGAIGTGTSFSTTTLSAGTHTITLTATDSKGATASATRSITITIPNRAPTASITSPTGSPSVVSGTSLMFAGIGTDPEDGPLSGASLTWASSIDGTMGTGTSLLWSGLSVGTHTISLTARDAQGLTNVATTTVTVTAPAPRATPPVAAFTVSCPAGGLGRYCRFDASASSDATGIAKYAWDWGDGRTETLTTPTRVVTYTRAGTYTVVLTVTDNAGLSTSFTKTISVR